MTEEMNGGCCSAADGKVGKDALAVSGAVLAGSLVIAGAVLFAGSRMPMAAVPSADAVKQQAGQAAKPEVTMDMVKGLFDGKNISFGKKDSKVLFVEFSDPSCPYCSIAAGHNPGLNKQAGAQFAMAQDGGSYVPPVPEMKKLVDSGKAAYVWLYANGHGNGELATEALYCAHEKKKFWEAHDILMTAAGYDFLNGTIKSDRSKTAEMAEFLKDAVKPSDMEACLKSGKYGKRLADDMAVATAFGFSGTPSFFINTKGFAGAYSFKDMQATVDQFLK